jgi:hypothetical protein
MSFSSLIRFVATVGVLLSATVTAEEYAAPSWPLGNPPEGWRPAPFDAGSWFDRERNGAGWAIEKLSPLAGQTNPLYAGTVYTYDSSGKPYWLLMAGTLQYTGWDEYFRTSVSAKFGGVLNDGINGACPTCNYVAPNVGPSAYGIGEIRFLGAARADVYFNNDTTPVERLETSEHILLSSVANLLQGTWERQRYIASGRVIEYGSAFSTTISEVSPPAWAASISSDSAVLHRPSTQQHWFSVSGMPEYPLTLDENSGLLIQYCFSVAANCGTETLGATGELTTPSRIAFHMSQEATVTIFNFNDRNTMTTTTFINNKNITQNAPYTTNYADRFRRIVAREQQ